MGKPLAPPPLSATGLPASGDRANGVVSGTLVSVGSISLPYGLYGAFNVSIWGSVTGTLTTTTASTKAFMTVTSTVVAGAGINSTAVGAGANIASMDTLNLSGIGTIFLGGLSTAQVAGIVASTDTAAVFVGVGITAEATVQLERSFDGGATWLVCGIGGSGTPAVYAVGAAGINNPITFTVGEPEQMVAYRLHCTVYTSGTINYRISATGVAPTAWGIPVS